MGPGNAVERLFPDEDEGEEKACQEGVNGPAGTFVEVAEGKEHYGDEDSPPFPEAGFFQPVKEVEPEVAFFQVAGSQGGSGKDDPAQGIGRGLEPGDGGPLEKGGAYEGDQEADA